MDSFCYDNNYKKDNKNNYKQQIFSKANLGFFAMKNQN